MTAITPKRLILCDFDGTLTRHDSWLAFLFQVHGRLGLFVLLLQSLDLLLSSFMSPHRRGNVKQAMLVRWWRPYKRSALEEQAIQYTKMILPTIVRPAFLNELRAEKQAGATIALVSASLDVWLAPFCASEGFTLICTRAKWDTQGSFVGFDGLNCNHTEKARRIQAHFKLSDFQSIVGFGNTRGDAAMLRLADTAWMIGKSGQRKKFV